MKSNAPSSDVITRTEIEAKASEFNITPVNVERDYVVGWLLAGIYAGGTLSRSLILKGGMCFRKAYFPTTRFSHDVDFSTQTSLDPSATLLALNDVCSHAREHAGIEFDLGRNRLDLGREIDRERRVYEGQIYFRDFYGNPNKFTISVSLDIVEFDKVYLPVQSRYLIHPYSDSDACRAEIRCLKLEEMLANKLKCLLQRRHVADLYDLAHSVLVRRDLAVNRSEVVSTFLKKTIFSNSPGAARQLLLDLPWEFARRVWDRYIICPTQGLFDCESAIAGVRSLIESLFPRPAVAASHGSAPFYPSAYRNTIMDAALQRKLLRATYDGITRVMEPYSLRYRRRKDGHAEEYFYAWDRTGGRFSGPGMKTFVHSKLQALEVMEETFEPQYPIELSRASEYPEKFLFGSPSTGTRSTRPRGAFRVRRTTPRLTYLLECSYCGRRFYRIKYSTRLRRHKDMHSNDCYGRSGMLISQQYR